MEEVQPRRRVRRRPAFAVVIRYGQVDVGTRARAAALEARVLGPRGALLATGGGRCRCCSDWTKSLRSKLVSMFGRASTRE